jgi:hypothetical protein
MTRVPRTIAMLARLGLTTLAGGALVATAGCATPIRASTVVFSIPYVNDCPGMPTSSSPCGGVKDCAEVKGGNATVEFRAIGPLAESREFKVQFDPFRETGLESHGGGTTGPVRVPRLHSGTSTDPKVFTFFIVDKKNAKCVPVDPRIIVEN